MAIEPSSVPNRSAEIELVMKERSALVAVCRALNTLLDEGWDATLQGKDFPQRLEIDGLLLQVSKHLANIAGFCDGRTQDWTHNAVRLLALCMVSPSSYIDLKAVLPFIVGIQVDFTKRPFRVVGLSLKGLGAELKAIMKR